METCPQVFILVASCLSVATSLRRAMPAPATAPAQAPTAMLYRWIPILISPFAYPKGKLSANWGKCVHSFDTSSAICSESVTYKASSQGRYAPPALRPASAALKSEKTHHSEVANSKLTFHATSYSLPSDVSPEPKPPRHAKGSTHADWVGSTARRGKLGRLLVTVSWWARYATPWTWSALTN